MFKFLRTLSVMRRPLPPSSLFLLNQNGPVHIQRVRFLRPFFTKKRVRQTLFAVVVTITSYKALLKAINEDGEEESKEEVNTQEYQEGDGKEDEIPDTLPEDALFIPLSPVRQRPAKLYKGSDPEWQSFVQFAQDRKRRSHIERELATYVGSALSSKRSFQKFLGAPIVVTRFWLDVDFPDGPPPEYERSGLEITDDYVAWTTRPIDPVQLSRLQTFLQPLPLLSALWASYRVLWNLQLVKIKDFLNVQPKDETSKSSGLTGFSNLQKSAGTGNKQNSYFRSFKGGPSESQTEYTVEDFLKEEYNTMDDSAPPEDAQTFFAGNDMKVALKVFERTLAKSRKPRFVLERGALFLSGKVEVWGSRAVCTVDVIAGYNALESKWLTVAVDIRRLQLKRMFPKGGT